jgi:hypothetical protein
LPKRLLQKIGYPNCDGRGPPTPLWFPDAFQIVTVHAAVGGNRTVADHLSLVTENAFLGVEPAVRENLEARNAQC